MASSIYSKEVLHVQHLLNSYARSRNQTAMISEDGYAGPQTTHAIISFQRNHGLTVDGIAGSKTIAAIEYGILHPPEPPKPQHPKKVFQGKGVHVWMANHVPDFSAFHKKLANNGWDYTLIKAHQGNRTINSPSAIDQFIKAAHDYGMKAGIWGYPEAKDPRAEAHLAADLCHKHNADFYVCDAEIEYQQAQGAVSKEFCEAFRSSAPKIIAAMTSFGRIDYHAGIDFHSWKNHKFDFMPQAYFNEGASTYEPGKCIEAARKYWAADEIHPIIGDYLGGAGWPSTSALEQTIRPYAERYGFSVWDALHIREQDIIQLGRL